MGSDLENEERAPITVHVFTDAEGGFADLVSLTLSKDVSFDGPNEEEILDAVEGAAGRHRYAKRRWRTTLGEGENITWEIPSSLINSRARRDFLRTIQKELAALGWDKWGRDIAVVTESARKGREAR